MIEDPSITMSDTTRIILAVLSIVVAPLVSALTARWINSRITDATKKTQTNIENTEKAVIDKTQHSVNVAAGEIIAQQSSGLQNLVRVTAAVDAARRLGTAESGETPVNIHDQIVATERQLAALRVLEAEEALLRKADEQFEQLERISLERIASKEAETTKEAGPETIK